MWATVPMRRDRTMETPAVEAGGGAPAGPEPLRPQQRELFDEAVADDGNVVLVASTGFGKTRVAFEVVEAALRRHPRRLVVFLCPTVPLTNQQRDYWEHCSLLGGSQPTSAIVAGGGGGGFGRAQVTFATPAKFLSYIGSDEGALASLALLVIDECHHAHRDAGSSATGTSNHPYSEIAEAYRRAVGHRRPKLVGLTASPGATHGDIASLAAVFQARFIWTARSSVTETVTLRAGVGCKALAKRLTDLEAAVTRRQRVLAETDEATERDAIAEQIGQLIGLAALWRAVGSGKVLRRACAEIDEATPYLDLDVTRRKTKDGKRAKSGVSPVAEVIVQQLRNEADRAGDNFRAVVFVQTQLAARALAAHLRAEVGEEAERIRPGMLLGQSGDAGMTQTMQREALAQFRAGTVNVLIATSIAEEGLDIQQCSLVVRTEPPRTIISNVQGRGRARQLNALYAVLVLDGMLVQKTNKRGNVVAQWSEPEYVAKLTEQEEHAWMALQHFISSSGSGIARTSWSHFDSEQVAHALGGGSGNRADLAMGGTDWKSRLNVFLQQRDRPAGFGHLVCTYDFERRGPPHAPTFLASVTVSGTTFDGEERPTKKASEQSAAYVALGSLSIEARSLQIDPAARMPWHVASHAMDAADDCGEDDVDRNTMSTSSEENAMFDFNDTDDW